MKSNVLFSELDIYDFVQAQREKIKKAHEALPDDKALDESFVQEWKLQFRLNVPSLKLDQWEREEKFGDILIYIPFEGDPSAFMLSPSAYDGKIAFGDIAGNELVLKATPVFVGFDVEAQLKREIETIQSRLGSLRGSTEYLNEQLEIGLREAMMVRRRVIENKATARPELNIPLRRPVKAAPISSPSAPVIPKRSEPAKPANQTWDIFMSHASSDKPYVEPLVDRLIADGVTVWYDKHVLGWGDPLRRGINKGLVNSRHAIVVLSKAFLAERKWTEHELSGLFAREELGKLVILPIWHGIERENLLHYDPELADRMAKISETDDYAAIVQSVRKVLGRN